MEFTVQYFDPSEMSDGCTIQVVGRRGAGKTLVAADLLWYKRHLKHGICMSATESSNNFWEQYIPYNFVYGEWDPRVVDELRLVQQQKPKGPDRLPQDGAFAIFDDLMFDKKFGTHPSTRRLMMNGRHEKIFTIISAQWALGFTPEIRAQFDYIFICGDPLVQNQLRYYDHYGSVFPTFKDFKTVFEKCTENNEVLVLRQNAKSKDISKWVSFYRATPNLRFHVSTPEIWAYGLKCKEEEEARRRASGASVDMSRWGEAASITHVRKAYPDGSVEEGGDEEEGVESTEDLYVSMQRKAADRRRRDILARRRDV